MDSLKWLQWKVLERGQSQELETQSGSPPWRQWSRDLSIICCTPAGRWNWKWSCDSNPHTLKWDAGIIINLWAKHLSINIHFKTALQVVFTFPSGSSHSCSRTSATNTASWLEPMPDLGQPVRHCALTRTVADSGAGKTIQPWLQWGPRAQQYCESGCHFLL